MSGERYPWRRPRDLETVLAEVKPVLASLGIVEPGAGCSDAEIGATEGRSRPFPEDIRAFYRSMRPTELFAPGARKEFGFYTIGSKELTHFAGSGEYSRQDRASPVTSPLAPGNFIAG